jgi:hypothetical protein
MKPDLETCSIEAGCMKFVASKELAAYLALVGMLDWKTVDEEVQNGSKSENFAGYLDPGFAFLKSELYIDSLE